MLICRTESFWRWGQCSPANHWYLSTTHCRVISQITRGTEIFQTSRSHFIILGARKVSWRNSKWAPRIYSLLQKTKSSVTYILIKYVKWQRPVLFWHVTQHRFVEGQAVGKNQTTWHLKTGLIGSPKTLVTNHLPILCYIPGEWKPQLHCGRNLKHHMCNYLFWLQACNCQPTEIWRDKPILHSQILTHCTFLTTKDQITPFLLPPFSEQHSASLL